MIGEKLTKAVKNGILISLAGIMFILGGEQLKQQ